MASILIIEPEPAIREPIAAILEMRGHRVRTAGTAADAALACNAGPVDLVIMEPELTGGDGIRLIKRVFANAGDHPPAVILLTATQDKRRIMSAARIGIRHYLLKSHFTMELFEHRISMALAKRPAGLNADDTDDAEPSETDQDPSRASDPNAAPAADAPPERARPDPEGPPAPPRTREAPAASVAADIEKVGDIKPILPKARVKEQIEAYGQCRALSPTLQYALKLARSSESSVEQIAGAIKRDQALAMQIIKIANSATYHRGRPVTNVEQAAVRIGLEELRHVMMGVSVIEHFGSGEFDHLVDIMSFWEHSIATALIAERLARTTRVLDSQDAFILGLFHDVGRVVMIEQFGEAYLAAFTLAEKLGRPIEQIEKRLLHFDHADVAQLLFRGWGFPSQLIDPIALHHISMPNLKHLSPAELKPTSLLVAADRLAHALGLGTSGHDWVAPITAQLEAIACPMPEVERLVRDVPEHVLDMKCAAAAASDLSPRAEERHPAIEMLGGAYAFCSTAPSPDALGVMLERRYGKPVGDKPNGPDRGEPADRPRPRVLFCHLHAAAEKARLVGQTVPELRERVGDLDGLPVVIFSASPKIDAADLFPGRPVVLLPTPVRISAVHEAVAALLQDDRRAAA